MKNSEINWGNKEWMRGYNQAIVDIEDIFENAFKDLKYFEKNMTIKIAKRLLKTISNERNNISKFKRDGTICYIAKKNDFEWVKYS